MRFTTTAGAFRDALATARHATPSTPALVAYSGVLLVVKGQRLSVIGSDGETTIAAQLTVSEASDGQALLPPRPIASFLATVPADAGAVVDIDASGDVAVKVGDAAPYKFRPVTATFPMPPTTRGTPDPIDLSRLHLALGAVRAAVARDNPGVQLVSGDAGLILHSTDNYRLSRAVLPEAGFGEFSGLVALGVLDRVARHKITGISVDQRGSTLRFAGEDVVISSRLLSTPFPAVDTILSNPPADRVTVSASELHQSLVRLAAVAEGAPLRCKISTDGFTLSVSNIDLGSGTETVEVTGAPAVPFEFAVSATYLAEAVASHEAPRIDIAFSDPGSAVFVVSTDPVEVTAVVMPVRL